MELLWYFFFYSFLGFLLEKLYAAAIHATQRVRKCQLLLPLCPVYGLAMLAVLHLPPDMRDTPWRLWFYGALTITAVEFVMHLLYDKVLGVRFWDYSATKMDVDGRICMPFSVVWGLLAVAAVYLVQPYLTELARLLPPQLAYGLALLLVVDTFFSARVLRQSRDVELMSLPRLLRYLRAS